MHCGEKSSSRSGIRDDTVQFVLASGSTTRRSLLGNAGLAFKCEKPRIDEAAAGNALASEGEEPRDIASALAELKARRIGQKHPDVLTLGCDQVLDFEGRVVGKSRSLEEARSTLKRLRGKRHKLHSAAVVYENLKPVWRHVSTANLAMRDFSDNFLEAYLARNDSAALESVGCYKVEEEGIRLFSSIRGDWFAVLGLPLMEFVNFLYDRGQIGK
ncbi:MAG: Maf family protein [Albidovulum sp.]|nr:Maf family protein [Albidovulum sp.]